ncbi:hypothetical protein C0J52_06023 [Blattella germanica]|nr:hypothetical protein C0J52_06023 [Blattella germanica]
MHTIKLDDNALELGCQWVHGEKGNAVFNLVKDLDLLINSSVGSDERKISFIEESGNLIDPEIASKYFEVLEEISESTADLENYTASVGDYFDEEYPKRLQELSLKDTFLSKIFLNWYHKASNSYHACDSWYDLSGHGLWEYKECDGKQNWAWKNGYSSFLDVLMKKFPDPSKELPVREKIQLNTEVKRIVWANLPEENNGRVIVESSDGSTYVADHVILTGWNLGSVDKIYLKFPYKWWPKDFEEFAFLSSHEVTPCRRKVSDC